MTIYQQFGIVNNNSAGPKLGDNLQLLCSAASVAEEGTCNGVFGQHPYRLVIRQQPERSRVGSISEKVDRRPIDPPPIVQLIIHDKPNSNTDPQDYTLSPAYIMQVVLMDESGRTPLQQIKDHRAAAMAGSMVSPLHTLRDMSTKQGAYFVFSDLSVRMEGLFRLRFELYEMEGDMVHNRASALSDVFSVYSPKKFPGMMESTALSKLFADQGLRIRIRTEAGTKKRGRKATSICSKTFASKRARRSSNGHDNQQQQRLALAEICDPSNSCSSVATGTDFLMRSLAATNSFPHNQLFASSPPTTMSSYNHNSAVNTATSSSLLMLQRDPFPVSTYDYSSNKENIPPNTTIFESLHRSPMFNHNNNHIPSHSSSSCATENKLDLNDIAAVALLDSLSGNKNRSTAFTTVTTSPPAQSLALPATIAAPSSYQNYRIGPPLTSSSSFNPTLFVNASSTSAATAAPNGRFHTTFRSSAPTSSSISYDIQLPSITQPFYNSQIRNNSSNNNANVSGSNNIGISAATLPPLRGVPSQYFPPPTIN